MTGKTISVLVPVFNEANYLRECLDSILAQSGADFEICLSDNASTDGTWEIVQSYLRDGIPLVAFRHPKEVHPRINLLQTANMATGDLVYLVAGDDYILPGTLSAAVASFEVSPQIMGHVPRMIYFDDASGRHLATLPPAGFEDAINRSAVELIRFMMRNVTHDELFLGVFRREPYIAALLSTPYYSYETPGTWLFLMLICDAPDPLNRVRIGWELGLMKRNNKKVQTSWDRSENVWHGYMHRTLAAWLGSLTNIRKLHARGVIGITDALLLTLASRYSTNKWTPEDSTARWEIAGPLFGILVNPPVLLWRRASARFRRSLNQPIP